MEVLEGWQVGVEVDMGRELILVLMGVKLMGSWKVDMNQVKIIIQIISISISININKLMRTDSEVLWNK